MSHSFKVLEDGSIETCLTKSDLLDHPLLNKGRSFSEAEREEFFLSGLLPHEGTSLEDKARYIYDKFSKYHDPLKKHVFLRDLQDRDEVAFYKLLSNHIGEMLELVYTPVVGLACQKFSEIYRRARGLFISYPHRDKIDQILDNCPLADVRAMVVTDGGRILGLGDQGAGGMGIPIGKMSLYTVCGGLNPAFGLPVLLDVGTDNEELLETSSYIGWRHKRISETEYLDFVDQFVQAVKRKFPHVLLQWEDFAKEHAHLLLEKYRDQICTFNDDIQGTAAISTAGLLAAVRVLKQSIKEQRVVIVGAGSAGSGIATQIANAMCAEGLDTQAAEDNLWLIDKEGLVMDTASNLESFQKPFAKSQRQVEGWTMQGKTPSLKETVHNLKPTVLIGVSGVAGIFTEEVVRLMASHVKRPIILPLSNPDSCSEAKPVDLLKWTHGSALVATGTKFPDVEYEGKRYEIGQSNNHYIFPSVALGVLASGAKRVSESMFLAAATRLSQFSPALKDPTASLFPPPEKIPEISKEIAVAVGKAAMSEGYCSQCSDQELREKVEKAFWVPAYSRMKYKEAKALSR